jgi:hypothetical protein
MFRAWGAEALGEVYMEKGRGVEPSAVSPQLSFGGRELKADVEG